MQSVLCREGLVDHLPQLRQTTDAGMRKKEPLVRKVTAIFILEILTFCDLACFVEQYPCAKISSLLTVQFKNASFRIYLLRYAHIRKHFLLAERAVYHEVSYADRCDRTNTHPALKRHKIFCYKPTSSLQRNERTYFLLN
jgi:hypothetical protein